MTIKHCDFGINTFIDSLAVFSSLFVDIPSHFTQDFFGQHFHTQDLSQSISRKYGILTRYVQKVIFT